METTTANNEAELAELEKQGWSPFLIIPMNSRKKDVEPELVFPCLCRRETPEIDSDGQER